MDAKRVYMTGIRMGGFGTWLFAVTAPQRFAAIAPICGGGFAVDGFPKRVRSLVSLPTWVFHGARDGVVKPEMSQVLVDELQAAGGDVRFTLYPEASHDSWTESYANPELYH